MAAGAPVPIKPAGPGGAEAVAMSFGAEARPVRPLTPAQETQFSMASQIREARQASPENPLEALKPITEPAQIDIAAEVGRRIGTEATPLRDQNRQLTEEGVRAEGIRRDAERYDAIARQGFETAIPDPYERVAFRNEFIDTTLNRIPAFRDLPNELKNAVADDILRSGEYRKLIGELNGQRLLEGGVDAQTVEALVEARARFDEAQATSEVAQRAVFENDMEIASRQSAREEFDDPNSVKYKDIQDLESTEPADRNYARRNRAALKKNLGGDDKKLAQLEKAVRSGNAKVLATPDGALMQQVIAREGNLQRLADLRAERADLDSTLAQLQEKSRLLGDERVAAQNRRNEAENAFTTARAQKAQQEETLVKSMADIARDAGFKTIEAELPERIRLQNEILQRQTEEATDGDERRVRGQFFDRWETLDRRGRPIPNRNAINQDFETILHGGGPEAILRELMLEGLAEPGSTEFNALPPEEQARVRQERTRIEDRLRSDKDFTQKMSADIAKMVVLKKAQTGRIYEGELRVMMEYTTWGQSAIEGAIRLQMDTNRNISKFVEQFGGPASLLDRVRRSGRGFGMTVLLLLAGYTFFGGNVTRSLMAEEGVQGQGIA